MDSLPCEIVELIISFACSDKFVLVSETPVEVIEWEWERELITIKDEKTGRKRPVLSRYKWVPFWTDYDRERHLSF